MCQAPDFEKCGVDDAAFSPSPEFGMHVVSIGDGVAKSGLLATVLGCHRQRGLRFSRQLGCCLPWIRSWLTVVSQYHGMSFLVWWSVVLDKLFVSVALCSLLGKLDHVGFCSIFSKKLDTLFLINK
jgi:hypothetical protein